jgi:hypothetical protein
MRPRDHELRIGQRAPRRHLVAARQLLSRELVDPIRMGIDLGSVRQRARLWLGGRKRFNPRDGPDANGSRITRPTRLHQVFRELFVLLNIRA